MAENKGKKKLMLNGVICRQPQKEIQCKANGMKKN